MVLECRLQLLLCMALLYISIHHYTIQSVCHSKSTCFIIFCYQVKSNVKCQPSLDSYTKGNVFLMMILIKLYQVENGIASRCEVVRTEHQSGSWPSGNWVMWAERKRTQQTRTAGNKRKCCSGTTCLVQFSLYGPFARKVAGYQK